MSDRVTQRERLFLMLEGKTGEWIPLPQILSLGIAQYNARILELRRNGHEIECRKEWQGRTLHTWYRLVPKTGQTALFQNA